MRTQWDLGIFQVALTEEYIASQFQIIEKQAKLQVKKYQSIIQEMDFSAWKEFLQSEETLTKEIYRVVQAVQLAATNDQNNSQLTQLVTLVDSKLSVIHLILLPLHHAIKQLGVERLTALSQNPLLNLYTNYFTQLVKSVQYQLSLPEEKVITVKNQSIGSNYTQLYDQLTALQMYTWEKKQLTEGEVRSKRLDPNPLVRAKAFHLLAEYYSKQEQQVVRGLTYYGIVSDWVNEAKLRGFTDPIAAQNISEEMQDGEVQALIQGVMQRYEVYHTFLQYKAQRLGVDQLNYSDIFAPLTNHNISLCWEEGSKLVHETLKKFDPAVQSYCETMLNQGRVDVFPRKGKQGGAFASYNKYWGQFVKLNYVNDVDSITTYAHEMGHAYHGFLSQCMPEQVYNTPLVLAETASTFFQLLVVDQLRKEKPEIAHSLLFELLEDFFATVVRQIQYIAFEKRAHQIVWDGGVFSHETLNTLWAEEVEKMIGKSVRHQKELYKVNWSAIPHIFHTPFYCYAYAYGLLFALALYKKYQQTGDKEVLYTVLRLGGSKTPQEMREISGVGGIDELIRLGYEQVEEWMCALGQ